VNYRAPFTPPPPPRPLSLPAPLHLSSPAFPKRRQRGREGGPRGGGGTREQPGPPVVMARPSAFPSYVRLMGLCPARLPVHLPFPPLSPCCSAPRRPPPGGVAAPRPPRRAARPAPVPRPADSPPAHQTRRGFGAEEGGRERGLPPTGL